MKFLYGQAWDSDEMAALKPVVFANVIQNMRLVLEYARNQNMDLGEKDSTNAKIFLDYPEDMEINDDVGKIVKSLWANPTIAAAWEQRAHYQVLDCLAYYCTEIDRIASPGYIPSQQDILQVRRGASFFWLLLPLPLQELTAKNKIKGTRAHQRHCGGKVRHRRRAVYNVRRGRAAQRTQKVDSRV